MKYTRLISNLLLTALLICAIAAELACSSSGSSSGSGSTTTTTSTPTVSFGTPPPPATMAAGANVMLFATITGDTTNSGVTWSCTPGNSPTACGMFSSPTTVNTQYTAPLTAASVTIIVTSNADSAASAKASVTVTAPAPTLSLNSPPTAMFTAAKANLAATITGDPTNAGVNWSCTPTTTCGSFSSQSGTTATYVTSPTAGIVTITATSVSFPAVNASAPVTIVTALSGNYVFSLSGSNKGTIPPPTALFPYSPYSISGAFTVNDNGISAGEQDLAGNAVPDRINPVGSSLSPTADGHVLITLVTCSATNCTSPDPVVGVNGVETLNASFLPINPNKAFITEFDASAAASGTLYLQSQSPAPVTPSSGYIFQLNGLDTYGQTYQPMSMAGVINIDGPLGVDGSRTISGAGSIFDANEGGSGNTYLAQTFAAPPAANTVSAPDQFGRVTFLLNQGTATNDFFQNQLQLAGYIIDPTHIQLEEITDAFLGRLGGIALGQGTKTGTFGSADVIGNSYVVGLNGWDQATTSTGPVFQPLELVGVLTANSDGTISGFANYNDLSHGTGLPQSPYPITSAIYIVDDPGSAPPDAGTGRVTITGAISDFSVGPIQIPYLQLYLDGNGHALATVLAGTGSTLGGPGFQQTGSGSFTTASVNGTYVINATGWDHSGIDEFDSVGSILATGSAGTFSGAVDVNWFLSPSPGPTSTDVTVSGTIASTANSAANGIFTGSIHGLDVASPPNSDAFAFYLIDSTGDAVAMETDPNQLTLLYLFQQ